MTSPEHYLLDPGTLHTTEPKKFVIIEPSINYLARLPDVAGDGPSIDWETVIQTKLPYRNLIQMIYRLHKYLCNQNIIKILRNIWKMGRVIAWR